MTDQLDIAAIEEGMKRRICLHEAAHAVSAVHRGGRVIEILIADDQCHVLHESSQSAQPFVTWAGIWCDARTLIETGEESDFDIALDYALDMNCDGDAQRYELLVEPLKNVAKMLGLEPVGHTWEIDWADELDDLMPAIEAVAARLVDGARVEHNEVAAAVAALDLETLWGLK